VGARGKLSWIDPQHEAIVMPDLLLLRQKTDWRKANFSAVIIQLLNVR
jgi:hypothetical protein